tara:strand:+ start:206 stop:394 length:189 start_codon:yes stop_codon:yes gene_type:complete
VRKEKINISQMKEDLIELNTQVETFLQLQSDNRAGKAYIMLMEKIIERRNLLQRQLTNMGEL